MNNIEDLVNIFKIKEQREKIINNRREILKIKKKISDLKIHREVAVFANTVNQLMRGEEIYGYMQIINDLKTNPWVHEYIILDRRVKELENEIKKYYQTIQINLRKRLDYPDIFVYYGTYNDEVITRNIIGPGITDFNQNNTTIFPDEELKSKRKIRHFYNRTSFKYLEELSKDNSFSIENKNVGKVKILKKEVDK